MRRFTLPLKARKLPVAASVVAAFASIWLTCKDSIYYSNSYGSMLWQYFVPGFLKTDSNSPNIPGKQSSSPHASRKLPHVEIRRNEKLVPVNIGVVSHYESNNLASNEPMEDRNTEYRVQDGLLFGVFDGHSGWQCAEEVMTRLPYYVAISMGSKHCLGSPEQRDKLFSTVAHLEENQAESCKNVNDIFGLKVLDYAEEKSHFDNTSVEKQLMKAFSLLDDDIVYEALPDVNGYDHEKIMKGLSGACAIAAYIQENDLYVANSGDCRAVLGSRTSDGKWIATLLSVDQNALNQDETGRLRMEHPGEEFIIWNGRLLGHLQPFRAFGDVIFKWDSHMHKEFLNNVYGRAVLPPQIYRTPPYLIAEPVVSHHSLKPEDTFLVIATDGLWDMMSSDSAVQCVGKLLDCGDLSGCAQEGNALQFNGASQLIQEALGGDDEIKVTKMLNAPKHIRRAVRDDITVTVVYFAERKE